MEKQSITEEMGVHVQWYKDASKQTIETLPAFINHLMNDYRHDYGTICHAISACSIATAWACNEHPSGGITGFQAGAVMWGFIKNWSFSGNKTGLKIIDYDNLLYPQYEDKYEKTISESTWARLQEEARKNIIESTNASQRVIDHWISIANGIVPFGFTVTED